MGRICRTKGWVWGLGKRERVKDEFLWGVFSTSNPVIPASRIYTNKIDRKYVDFLLCNPKAVRPFLGIELDDKSHQREDRQERDQFVDQVFKAGGIPLVRVAVKYSYSLQEVQTVLQPYIQLDASKPPPPDDKPQQSWTKPRCTIWSGDTHRFAPGTS